MKSGRASGASGAAQADSALVLRRTPFGETSLVVHVLTRAGRRVGLMAKGAHRPKSRFSGVLDWFDTLRLEWSERRGAELGNLSTGDLETRRRHIARVVACYRRAQSMVELCELATRVGQNEPGLFERLERGLDALEARAAAWLLAPGAPGELEAGADRSLIEFELGFLQNLGLLPALEACAACGRAAPPVGRDATEERVAFSAGAGGRLCAPCAAEARSRGRRVGTLPRRVLETAARLGRPVSAPRAGELTPSPDMTIRVRDLLERFLDYHLEARPNSLRAFLDVPNRNAPSGVRD